MEDWQVEQLRSQTINSLACDLIADIISAQMALHSYPNEFNIDDYWNDIKENVLLSCSERYSAVKFTTCEEEN
mgnify:CR=1 FL=1